MTDRQARNMILAAEVLGFEREPDLHPRWYNAMLHEDAGYALAWVIARRPELTPEIFRRAETIPPEEAGERIVNSGLFSCADAAAVIEAAAGRGFAAPVSDLPLLPWMQQSDQARAAIAFLWERDSCVLKRTIGEKSLLAPIPETARIESLRDW